MFHPNSLNRTSSQAPQYDDAFARTQAAARELNYPPEALKPFDHPSDRDVFFEGTSATAHEPLFFKTHLGTPEELGSWSEPKSAGWAERAGCGAKVFPTKTAGVLVTQRLPGSPMTRDEGNQPFFARQVAASLHRLHNAELSVANAKVPPATGAACNRIRDALSAGKVSEQLAAQIRSKAEWIDKQFSNYAIEIKRRFGDCHFGNWLVVGDRLYAVDLADSCFGDPFSDLARYGFCQRFNHEQLQALLKWYLEVDKKTPTEEERRRLRLHAMAQNLDYFGYFASLTGATSEQTKNLASRVLADEAIEPEYPRGCFDEVFGTDSKA